MCALGAGFGISVVAQLLIAAVYPVLFPPTREQPIVIPIRVLWEGAGAIAAGAVALRAGGSRAVLLCVLFELLVAFAELPARAFACSRTPAGVPNSPCDYMAIITGRWTFWIAFSIGLVASRALGFRERTRNTTLRAAGVLTLAITILQSVGALLLFLVVLPNSALFTSQPMTVVPLSDVVTYAWALGALIGCAFAGAVLSSRPLAAPLLIALLLMAPSLAQGVVLWRGQTGMPLHEPLSLLIGRFAWLWVPASGALVLFIAWSLARRREPSASEGVVVRP